MFPFHRDRTKEKRENMGALENNIAVLMLL